jgi:hypothetical protein
MADSFTKSRTDRGQVILTRTSTAEVTKEQMIEYLQDENEADARTISRLEAQIADRTRQLAEIEAIK